MKDRLAGGKQTAVCELSSSSLAVEGEWGMTAAGNSDLKAVGGGPRGEGVVFRKMTRLLEKHTRCGISRPAPSGRGVDF